MTGEERRGAGRKDSGNRRRQARKREGIGGRAGTIQAGTREDGVLEVGGEHVRELHREARVGDDALVHLRQQRHPLSIILHRNISVRKETKVEEERVQLGASSQAKRRDNR